MSPCQWVTMARTQKRSEKFRNIKKRQDQVSTTRPAAEKPSPGKSTRIGLLCHIVLGERPESQPKPAPADEKQEVNSVRAKLHVLKALLHSPQRMAKELP